MITFSHQKSSVLTADYHNEGGLKPYSHIFLSTEDKKRGVYILKKIISVMLMLILVLSACGISASAEGENEVVIWMWANQAFEPMAEIFEAKYPDCKVKLVTVEAADYIAKLQIALTTGIDVPDIGALEIDWRGRLYDLDCWYDLEKEFGFDKNDLFSYAQTLGTNSKGEFVSIQWDCDTAGLAYNKALAKQYLGTDDPAELEAMLKDWDSFIAKGIEVKEASNGEIFMLAALGDIKTILLNQDQTPFIENGVADLTASFSDMWKRLVEFRDAGIVDVLNQWTPAWSAAYALDKHIFFPAATWCIMGVIDPNNPGADDRWGLMTAPEGAYTWGGTALAVCKGSKNPEMAWKFIETALLSQEGWNLSKDPIGYFSTAKAAYEDPDYTNWTTKLTGTQNIGEFFFKDIQPDTIDIRPITSWDHIVRAAFDMVMEELMDDESMTAEDALARMIEEVSNTATDIEVR